MEEYCFEMYWCYHMHMSMPLSERRQIENEMIFRQANEKIGDNLDAIDAGYIEDDNPEFIRSDDILLYFLCECSDEDCTDRIQLKLSTYQKIHENRSAFIVKPTHQVEAIETVIDTKDTYSVVEKNNVIPEPCGTLNETDIDNS
jgi:hypothetical protein